MDFLSLPWLGAPVWMWLAFLAVVVLLTFKLTSSSGGKAPAGPIAAGIGHKL